MKKILLLIISLYLCPCIYAQKIQYETKDKGIYLYNTVSHLLYNKNNQINSWNTTSGINTYEKITSIYPLLREIFSQKLIEELASQKAILIIGTSINSTGEIKEVFFILDSITEKCLNENNNFINDLNTLENLLINKRIKLMSKLTEQDYYKIYGGIRFNLLSDWISNQSNENPLE